MATAFIPAKGVSVRVPNKNLIDLGGEPLISWTLRSCKEWSFIDQIFVATENKIIAEIAKNFGAIIYPLDSEDIDDKRTVSQLWKQFVSNESSDYQVLMHCTSPFHKLSEMEKASSLFTKSGKDILISMRKICHCIVDNEGNISPEDMFGRMNTRSQDRKLKYVLDGSYYISTKKYVEQCDFFEQGKVIPFPVGSMYSIEIDTMEELELCRAIASCGIDKWFEKYGN